MELPTIVDYEPQYQTLSDFLLEYTVFNPPDKEKLLPTSRAHLPLDTPTKQNQKILEPSSKQRFTATNSQFARRPWQLVDDNVPVSHLHQFFIESAPEAVKVFYNTHQLKPHKSLSKLGNHKTEFANPRHHPQFYYRWNWQGFNASSYGKEIALRESMVCAGSLNGCLPECDFKVRWTILSDNLKTVRVEKSGEHVRPDGVPYPDTKAKVVGRNDPKLKEFIYQKKQERTRPAKIWHEHLKGKDGTVIADVNVVGDVFMQKLSKVHVRNIYNNYKRSLLKGSTDFSRTIQFLQDPKWSQALVYPEQSKLDCMTAEDFFVVLSCPTLAQEIASHKIVGLDGVFKLTIYGYVYWAIVFAYSMDLGVLVSSVYQFVKQLKK